MADTFTLTGELIKVDESLGLVLGYAMVCTENGEPYYDLQGDYIQAFILSAALTFASICAMWAADFIGRRRRVVPQGVS